VEVNNMAQNVESNVYIKINADTGQVELQVDKVKERMRELVAEAKQGKIEFADFSESIDRLANGFSQLGNSTEQAKQGKIEFADFSESIDRLANGFSQLGNSTEQERIGELVAEAKQGKIEFADFSESIDRLANGFSQLGNSTEQARELVAEAKHGKIEFADFSESIDNLFSESIDNLANGFSQLGNSTEQVSENMEDIGDGSGESAVNVEQLTGLLGQLANGGKISASTFEKLGSALGLTGGELVAVGGAATVAVAGIKLLADNTKEMISAFTNVGSAIGEGAFQGVEWFVDSLKELSEMLDETIEKLQEFADMGIEIQNSYIGLGNFIGTDAIAGLDEYANALESLIGLDATGVIADMSKLGGAIAELGATADQAEAVSESLYELALNLHGFNPSTSTTQAIEGITKALQTEKIDYRTNRALYNLIGSEGVQQFEKLSDAVERYNFLMENSSAIHDAYQKYLETDAGKIEILRQQYSSLMGNIGQIALHLYAMVAPVLTAILQLANGVLSALIKIFNINVRTSTGAGGASGLSGLKEDIDEVGKSAGKATKQLASFDDVIQINDSKSGGSALGDIDTAGLGDFGSILDDLIDDSNELIDIWAHFKELMEQGDYFGAGKEFMQVIADQLRKIPWDDIKNKASETGKAVADFLNSIFDGSLNWKTIGETIAEALNTIIAAVRSFLKEFDFKMMGKALGTAWDSLWDNLDIDGAAEALYEAFMGVFELVNGWLEGGGLSRAAEGIAQFITSLFSNFTIEDTDEIVNAVTGVIDDIINALSIVAEALTSDDVKRVVFALITNLVTSFKENAADWGTALHDIANDILDFIIEGINTADGAGLDEAVGAFLWELKLGELVSKWMQIKWQVWKFEFRTEATAFFDMVIGFILQAIKNLLLIIGALLAELTLIIVEACAIIFGFAVGLGERIANWLTEETAKIRQEIGTFLGNIIGKVIACGISIVTSIASIGTAIGNKFSEIGESIKSIFSGIWDFVSSIFDPQNWIDLGTAAIDGLWSAIKSIWNNTVSSLSLDIPGFGGWDGIHVSVPKLATGGIVTSATTALIGEAGSEAVLPLDNNTQWMDRLATKLANQINSGAGQNGGTVRVELSDKPFYTRAEMYEFGSLIVESLKAYGLNIAIV